MDYLKKIGLALLLTLVGVTSFAQVKPIVPANTILGNALSSPGPSIPLTVGQVNSLLGTNASGIPFGLTVTNLQALYPASNYSVNTVYATADAGLVQGNGSTWIQGTTFPLLVSGMDFIFLPSGTMANNCAFTVPALDRVYSNAYAYFGPGAIAASSNPGWYYVVMSSTTAGTCYNNQYTFGNPSPPSSTTAFSTTGPGAFTGLTGVGIPGYYVNVPPFALGLNGRLSASISWSMTSNTNSKTLAFIYGGSNTGSDAQTNANPTNSSTSRTMTARGATNAEITTGTNADGSAIGPNFETIDGTLNQTYWISFNRAVATDYIVAHSVSIDVRPAGALDNGPTATAPIGSATVVPACAASFGFNTNKWYLRPTAASVSLTTNTTSPLFAASGQSSAHFTTVNGMLSLNQLGDGVNVGVDSINNSNVAGTLQTLPSANGWYYEVAARLTSSTHDAWPAAYTNPIEKQGNSTVPYVELDGDEQIGAISTNIPFNGSTESTLDWPSGSGGSAVTSNNLTQTLQGFAIDRTQWHVFGFGYDPVSQQTFYCLDGSRQPFSKSTTTFDSDINSGHYFLILNASSHGLHTPYSNQISYISAWSSR